MFCSPGFRSIPIIPNCPSCQPAGKLNPLGPRKLLLLVYLRRWLLVLLCGVFNYCDFQTAVNDLIVHAKAGCLVHDHLQELRHWRALCLIHKVDFAMAMAMLAELVPDSHCVSRASIERSYTPLPWLHLAHSQLLSCSALLSPPPLRTAIITPSQAVPSTMSAPVGQLHGRNVWDLDFSANSCAVFKEVQVNQLKRAQKMLLLST